MSPTGLRGFIDCTEPYVKTLRGVPEAFRGRDHDPAALGQARSPRAETV